MVFIDNLRLHKSLVILRLAHPEHLFDKRKHNYPISLDTDNPARNTGDRIVRYSTIRHWKEHAKLKNSRESFTIDTAKLWNQVQLDIKNAESIGIAKARIKIFCRTLEI